MKEMVLIPAYRPDERLIELVTELRRHNLEVLVVNDGSEREYDKIFSTAAGHAHLTAHEKNRGKGCTLKTGIKYILENFSDCEYIITADADGQHRVEDILRVRDEMRNGSEFVLTTRKLNKKIPFRSKFGNDLSRFIYTLATGKYFSDNQSGLRGFTKENAQWLLKVAGEKYDYEMNALYYAAKLSIPITTLDIEAVYIDGNKSSHFNPVKDTARIYKLLFFSARGSLISAVLAQVIILLSLLIPGTPSSCLYITMAGVLAAICTYMLNRFAVLKDIDVRDGLRTMLFTVVRYVLYTLFTAILTGIFPALPIYVAFIICLLAGLPIRYFLHKYVDALN